MQSLKYARIVENGKDEENESDIFYAHYCVFLFKKNYEWKRTSEKKESKVKC